MTELVIGAAAVNPGSAKLRTLADHFRFVQAVPGEVERIVMKDVAFENVGQWVDKLARLRRTVCRIEPQPPPDVNNYGTGFLVAPDVVMTNYHVASVFPAQGPGGIVLRFDFETEADGVAVGSGRVCHLATDWKLAESSVSELDFALVRLAEPAGNDALGAAPRGSLAPVSHDFHQGDPLIILQHPAAQPLKLAIGSVVDPNIQPNRVSYTVNTEPGSSGSPCFTTGLAPVALHNWGAIPNRGIRMGPILESLRMHKAELQQQGLSWLLS